MTNVLSLALPTSAADVATLQSDFEADALAVALVTVQTPEDYTFADELLTDIVTRKDAAVAMRKRATGPMYTAIREVESWFRPLVTVAERCEKHLKAQLSAFRVAQLEAEQAARAKAFAAVESNDAGATIEALTEAAELAQAPDGRATVRYRWTIKRISEDLLPREYFCPDTAKIEREALEYPGDGPAPVIPGVVFERTAIVGAKR